MKTTSMTAISPYQVLFPLGIAHAIAGAALWVMFAFGLTTYPGLAHAQQMLTGFLLSFASGFLLTAIPRFTGTADCSPTELLFATGLSLLALFKSHSVIALTLLLFLVFFVAIRFKQRSFTPPAHFLFLPIGLLLGIAGTALMSLVEFRMIDARFVMSGRLLFFYGTMLSLLLGIGAKLVTSLLGWTGPMVHQIEPIRAARRVHFIPAIQVFIFLASFAVEILGSPLLGRALRAVVATWIAVSNWHLHQLPRAKGKFPFWLWVSAWTLLIGLWVHALFASLAIHAAHLIFVGGLGLMTLLVASRVTLAHGGYPMDIELKSWIFPITGSVAILAALTRFGSQWTHSYFHHLAYAAALWITVILIWGAFFVPKMIFHSKE